MQVKNSNVNSNDFLVTVFGRNDAGQHFAQTMPRREIVAPKTFSRSVEEVVSRIIPTSGQSAKIVAALDAQMLTLADLRRAGGEHGGVSEIAV